MTMSSYGRDVAPFRCDERSFPPGPTWRRSCSPAGMRILVLMLAVLLSGCPGPSTYGGACDNIALGTPRSAFDAGRAQTSERPGNGYPRGQTCQAFCADPGASCDCQQHWAMPADRTCGNSRATNPNGLQSCFVFTTADGGVIGTWAWCEPD
jgi:hypothetical protein